MQFRLPLTLIWNLCYEWYRHSINLITRKPTQRDRKASTFCIKKLYWRFYVKNWTSRKKLYYGSSGLWIGWAAGKWLCDLWIRSIILQTHKLTSVLSNSTRKVDWRLRNLYWSCTPATSNRSAAMFGAVQGRWCFLNLTIIIARGKDINNHKGNLWALYGRSS